MKEQIADNNDEGPDHLNYALGREGLLSFLQQNKVPTTCFEQTPPNAGPHAALQTMQFSSVDDVSETLLAQLRASLMS